jgi:hypothetical protein
MAANRTAIEEFLPVRLTVCRPIRSMPGLDPQPPVVNVCYLDDPHRAIGDQIISDCLVNRKSERIECLNHETIDSKGHRYGAPGGS